MAQDQSEPILRIVHESELPVQSLASLRYQAAYLRAEILRIELNLPVQIAMAEREAINDGLRIEAGPVAEFSYGKNAEDRKRFLTLAVDADVAVAAKQSDLLIARQELLSTEANIKVWEDWRRQLEFEQKERHLTLLASMVEVDDQEPSTSVHKASTVQQDETPLDTPPLEDLPF